MSITSIKITALTDIGNSIAYTTLVPVVDMAGTPTTEKANLQILGNLILSGSGGSYFAKAAQAVNAQTVSNAAQPAITSVGTLTALTVSGVSNLGPVANVTITGGTAGYVLSTNGSGLLSWAIPSSGATGVTGATGPAASLVLSTSTTANLSDATNAVNTTGKSQGLMKYDTTNNMMYVASGSLASDAWYPSDGSSPITPV
jgi:hypothetical protein